MNGPTTPEPGRGDLESKAALAVALVEHLIDQVTHPERAGAVLERAAAYPDLPIDERLRQLPAIYLLLEQVLADKDGPAIAREPLRRTVRTAYPALLTLPGFDLIFASDRRQEILLCRALLRTLLERARARIDADEHALLDRTLSWIDTVPDAATLPVPFDVAANLPISHESWIRLLADLSQQLYNRVEQALGQQAARKLYAGGYDALTEVYLALPTFPVVVGLLPGVVLDERQVSLLSRNQMQRVLLEKLVELQGVNAALARNNAALEDARQALEEANAQLEARVAVRTEALADANAQLRASEERFRLISSSAQEAIVVLDDTGGVTFWNPAAENMFGWNEQDMLGQDPIGRVIPRRHWPPMRAAQATFLRDGSETGGAVTVLCVTKTGRRFPAEASFSSVRMGERWHLVCVARDITERRRAETERRGLERQIQQRQRLESLGVLAGGIAHDFNNLLAAIMGNVDLALRAIEPEAAHHAYLVQAKGTARRAADLTEQMLAYSGKGRFVIESLSVTDLLREMTQLLSVSISKRAAVTYDVDDAVPLIEADRAQLQQVVMNLITNASDALDGTDGVIVVRTGVAEVDAATLSGAELDATRGPGSYVFVEVEDSGAGMDTPTRANIFEPFFTTKRTGRGLGLAAVLGIVRGHGGAISVTSEPGRGTIFRVLFPAVAAASEPATQPVAEALGSWRGEGTVLVVDDEPVVQLMVKAVLNEAGFEVLTADDGVEGVSMFSQRAEDIVVVLLDLTMPRMDGAEALAAIREIRADVPVVLFSGYSEQEASKRLVGQGLAGFVKKPFEVEDLLVELRRVLGE